MTYITEFYTLINFRVDQLLNGGLFTGNIYELCGLPASGKTHFVLSLIRNVVLSTQQQVYVFDTKNDFSGTKMKRMLNDCNEVNTINIFHNKISVSESTNAVFG